MALEDFVLANYGAAFLKQIANPESTTASAVTTSTPTLVAACNAARGRFYWRVGHKVDETNAVDANGNPISFIELSLAGEIAVYYFRNRRGFAPDFLANEIRNLDDQLWQYARLGSEQWAAPATNSTLSPTRETDIASGPVRPFADTSAFSGTDPWPGGGSSSSRGDSSPVGL